MRIIRFIIIGLIFFNNTFSQTFEKTINDNLLNTVFPGRNIQVTANGDYLVAGKTVPVNGINKIILSKFLSSGEKLWTKVYENGEYVNYHISLEMSQDGGYVISASGPYEVRIIKIDRDGVLLSIRSIDTGDFEDKDPTLLETENEDFILAGTRSLGPADNYQRIISFTEYNSDGQFVSENEIKGESHLTLQFITEVEGGGYIIGGYSGFRYPEGSCLFIAKLEANGDTIWIKKYENITTVLNSNIFETQNEQFIVVGTWQASNTSINQIFLMWIDTDGIIMWEKSQLLHNSKGFSVRQTFDKGFVLTGSTEEYGNGQNDLLILKTNILGDSAWANTYGGANSDYGYEIKQTADSGFIVLGSSDSFEQSGSYLVRTDKQGNVACRLDHSTFFTPGISSISVDIYSELTTVGFDPVFRAGKILLYKESNITGKYNIVNTLQNFETNVVNDTSSYPVAKSHKYKIRVINECGDTSLFSEYHRSVYLDVYVGGSNMKSLIWNHYEGANVISYEILRGADMNTFSVIDSIPGSINIYSDLNPPVDETMYQIKAILSTSNDQINISYSNAATAVYTNIRDKVFLKGKKIKIYPNPVSGQSIVEFSNPDNKKFDCFVFDISGRVLRYYSNITGSSFVFRKKGLTNGIYFIELRGPKIIRGRIIIE